MRREIPAGVLMADSGLDRKNTLRCDFLLLAGVLFLVLTSVAMVFYPGTNHHDNANTHYSFTRNFFSDLGATRTYAHHGNTVSSVLFTSALALVGIAIILFAFIHTAIPEKKRWLSRLGKASVFFGVVSGVAFIGIAAAPENVSLGLHELFVEIAFGFLLIFVAVLAVLQVADDWGRVYVVANTCYLVLLAAYVVIIFVGPGINTLNGLQIQAICQKVIVYASILNVGIQAFGIRRYLQAGYQAEARLSNS